MSYLEAQHILSRARRLPAVVELVAQADVAVREHLTARCPDLEDGDPTVAEFEAAQAEDAEVRSRIRAVCADLDVLPWRTSLDAGFRFALDEATVYYGAQGEPYPDAADVMLTALGMVARWLDEQAHLLAQHLPPTP
jgi:hypothetical protein